MTELIAKLVGALRQELEQYGEMLALLERQQQQIGRRNAHEVYESITPIKLQGTAIQRARTYRDDCRAELAQSLQQARETNFARLIPLLPAECRPLMSALVQENNELLLRVRQRARQNHLHLHRSIELMQNLINSLFPSREPRTYNALGSMKPRRAIHRPMYEAMG